MNADPCPGLIVVVLLLVGRFQDQDPYKDSTVGEVWIAAAVATIFCRTDACALVSHGDLPGSLEVADHQFALGVEIGSDMVGDLPGDAGTLGLPRPEHCRRSVCYCNLHSVGRVLCHLHDDYADMRPRVAWPGADAMQYDTEFAKRRFPEQTLEIESLASRNESFRDLCNDFSIADQLVRDWESSTAPERDAHYAEALELMDGLAAEIHTMLDLAKVVPFPAAR